MTTATTFDTDTYQASVHAHCVPPRTQTMLNEAHGRHHMDWAVDKDDFRHQERAVDAFVVGVSDRMAQYIPVLEKELLGLEASSAQMMGSHLARLHMQQRKRAYELQTSQGEDQYIAGIFSKIADDIGATNAYLTGFTKLRFNNAIDFVLRNINSQFVGATPEKKERCIAEAQEFCSQLRSISPTSADFDQAMIAARNSFFSQRPKSINRGQLDGIIQSVYQTAEFQTPAEFSPALPPRN